MRTLLPALLLALALAPAPARAQACGTALPRAEADYRAGRFDEAIDRLEQCLDANAFQADDRRQAYRLIGLSFIGKDREAEAREAVRNLLLAAPDYRPDPNLDPPPFVALVEQERRAAPARRAAPVASAPAAYSASGLSLRVYTHGLSNGIEDDRGTGGGLGLGLGYGFTPRVAGFVQVEGAGVSDAGTSYVQGYLDLGVRFLLGGGGRALVPYGQAALSGQTATWSDLYLVEPSGRTTGPFRATFTGGAVTLGGGLLYFFSPALALDAGLALSLGSYTSVEVSGSSSSNFDALSSSAARVQLGVSWYPLRR